MLSRLQAFSAGIFTKLQQALARTQRWIQDRPKLAAWVFPTEEVGMDARYREFNHRYFASFREQERMLADKPRMDFYHTAIARHVKPGDRVVDLGTGTGILAAFAARRGAAQVYAIDHSSILEHAKTLAAHNRMANIEFIATHSQEFKVDERVDVILHEQMGDCLFDESMVANITDLRERVLKPGGLILPSRFELYCEPVQIKNSRVVPFIWELEVKGYDYSCLERHRPQEPEYYHLCSTDRGLIAHFLGTAVPLLSLDLHTIEESALPLTLRFARTVVNPGRLDGLVVYFRALVDDDLSLSSAPLDPDRAPHWGFRILRTEQETFGFGDVIDITLNVARWPDLDSWRWRHAKRGTQDAAIPGDAELTPVKG